MISKVFIVCFSKDITMIMLYNCIGFIVKKVYNE